RTLYDPGEALDGGGVLSKPEMVHAQGMVGQDVQLGVVGGSCHVEGSLGVVDALLVLGIKEGVDRHPHDDAPEAWLVGKLAGKPLGLLMESNQPRYLTERVEREVEIEAHVDGPADILVGRG